MRTFALGLFLILSCLPAEKADDSILGKWNMVGVRIYNDDVSPQLNPMNDRWISFQKEGTFTSGSGEKQENAGTYALTLPENRLDLDSNAGPGDDSSWRLTFRNDTLLMRGIGTERQEASEVVLIRYE